MSRRMMIVIPFVAIASSAITMMMLIGIIVGTLAFDLDKTNSVVAAESLATKKSLKNRRTTQLRHLSSASSRHLEEQNDYYDSYYVNSGFISKATCHAFTVDPSNSANDDENDENGNDRINLVDLSGILEWNHMDEELFHVPQQSFIFYEYNDNNGGTETMVVNMLDWMESMASITASSATTSYSSGSSCIKIDDPLETFSNIFGHAPQVLQDYLKIDVTEYAQTGSAIPQWEPALYQGPICGLENGNSIVGRRKNMIQIGIFLDASCTILAPQFMDQYNQRYQSTSSSWKWLRTMMHKNNDENDNSSKNLRPYIDAVNEPSKKTLSCKKYNICSALIGNSVDTDDCGVDDNDNNENGNDDQEENDDNFNEDDQQERRRRLEDAQNGNDNDDQEQDENDAENNNDDAVEEQQQEEENEQQQAEDDEENAERNDQEDVQEESSSNGYQLSQDDLQDMSSTCSAVTTSLALGQTLALYLVDHGHLPTSTNKDKSMSDAIKLMAMILVVTTMAVCVCYYRTFRASKPNSVKLLEDGRGTDTSSSYCCDPQVMLERGASDFGTATVLTNDSYLANDTFESEYTSMPDNCDDGDANDGNDAQTTASSKVVISEGQEILAPTNDEKEEVKENDSKEQSPKQEKVPKRPRRSTTRTWVYSLRKLKTPNDKELPLMADADLVEVKSDLPPASAQSTLKSPSTTLVIEEATAGTTAPVLGDIAEDTTTNTASTTTTTSNMNKRKLSFLRSLQRRRQAEF